MIIPRYGDGRLHPDFSKAGTYSFTASAGGVKGTASVTVSASAGTATQLTAVPTRGRHLGDLSGDPLGGSF